MEFSIIPKESCVLIEVHGRIDSYTTPLLEEALKPLLAEGHHKFIVDLKDVSYVSSSGMVMLINLKRQCQTHPDGTVLLSSVSGRVLSSLQLAGFDQLFEIFGDSGSAIARV